MKPDLEPDVVVVGAGPAGSSAATTLARAGLDVVMVDRARFPRDKCCGDGLTAGALRRLDVLGLQPATVRSFTPVDTLDVRSPRGTTTELPLARPGQCHVAVARRVDLDAALVELARDAGVTVLDGRALEQVVVEEQATERACTARVAGGITVCARAVVAADGAWSRVRSLLAAGHDERAPRRSRALAGGLHAFRAYATQVTGPAATRMWVWFTPRLLPGYAWSFPLHDRTANVGICMRRAAGVTGHDLADAWRDELDGSFLRSLLGPGAAIDGSARSWPIPTGIDRVATSSHGGRVLYVGDAVGAADPFTGEGIAQALETGMAAAAALAATRARAPGESAARYASDVRRQLAVEHRIGRSLAAIAAHPAGIEAVVRVADHNGWTRLNAGRWLFDVVPRSLPFTPSRWRRGALHLGTPYPGLLEHGVPDLGVARDGSPS